MAIMTTAQALVKFLDNQYISFDGVEAKFVDGIFTLFGHGIVCGLGQALDENKGALRVYQGKNEQGMAHAAIAFAKQNNRRKIIACSSSIGPGAANMVTAAGTATVNNVPLLLFPADTYACRQPDPVLQQFEQTDSLSITTNDAFKAVCRYWDRVNRPEQLMSAMINAMRVLTDPAAAGAVCVSLPQDVEGEAYDFPESFYAKRVHKIARPPASDEEIDDICEVIKGSQYPLAICGGGVRYSEAGGALERFCGVFGIPLAETQAGKSACCSSSPFNLGGIGVTGNSAANTIAKNADLILGIGTRFSDFTTASKTLFENPNVKIVTINISRFDAYKLDAVKAVGDAKTVIEKLYNKLRSVDYKSAYTDQFKIAKKEWGIEYEKLASYTYGEGFEPLVKARYEPSISDFIEMSGGAITQTAAVALIREIIGKDTIAVGSSGSLPGDLQRMWTTDSRGSYNMEYGYSCMGYEICGALGAKLAESDKEVYAFVGDGSYLMLHSELVTSIQENAKINVLLFDNAGFGCINNLQMSQGMGNLATEFRRRDENGELMGNLIPIDYAMSAAGYGVKTYTAKTLDELREALIDSKKQAVSTLIDIKVLPKTMTDGYGAWWRVGTAAVSGKESVRKANEINQGNIKRAKKY
ncbi:MAG: 3D-(3,5/4)-trihydroxycyclohexane-1,2-dione acylhydrolase (decyclizing) [Oscillospiraceae bacterium]|nr:3D-(3,5/4)-trihydroxycyclohexane-1,2-dione acylhydrolase (decyclizing) [Oscillospiraceae bacterium]